MIIIDKSQFDSMLGSDKLKIGRKEMKNELVQRIEAAVSIRWTSAKKVRAVIDKIIYMLTDRGFSFCGRETLMKKLDVSLRTVDNAIRYIKDSNLFYVCYRENSSSNGVKTPIFIYKEHPNFPVFASLLNLECTEEYSEECKVENAETPGVSRDEAPKKGSTYSLPSLTKQENNNLYNMREIYQVITKLSTESKLEGNLKRIVEMLTLKITDAMKKGVEIASFSSYCEKVFWNEFRKFNAMENAKTRGISAKKSNFVLSAERIKQINSSVYAWI